MASLNISGYTFSTTSVPTSPALKVKSGTGTYYVNLTTNQRPEALSDQKVFTVSTTNYSFLRPFVTSNSLAGYSGVSNNSTLTTGYSGVSNNSTVTTGYAGVISRRSTYGYSGYSSSTSVRTNSTETHTTLSVSIDTWFGGNYVYAATFSPIVPQKVSWHYWDGATSIRTFSTSKGKVMIIGDDGQVGYPYAFFSIRSEVFSLFLTKDYKGTSYLTGYNRKEVTVTFTRSKTTDKYGVLLSQVPLTTSSSYNSSSTAKGSLSSITDLTRTTTRYSSSTTKGYLSSTTALTKSATRYSSSTTVGNLSSTTELRTITRL